jgi:hypothetical protein
MEGVEPTKVNYTHSGLHWDILLNIDLEINNERKDCKIGAVCVGRGYLWEGGEEQRRLRWGNMGDGLHKPITK